MLPVASYIKWAVTLSMLGGALSVVSMALLAFTAAIPFGENGEICGVQTDFATAFLFLAVLSVISFLASKYAFFVSHLGAFRLEQILRLRLSEHLAKVPLGYVVSIGTGALKKALLDDVKNLHAFVADSTPMIGKSVAAPVASLIAILLIDWRLAIASVSVLVVGGIVMRSVMRDSVTHRQNYERSQSDINRAVIEFVQAMPVVRTFDDGSGSFKRYSGSLNEYKKNLKAWIAQTGVGARIGMTVLGPMPTLLVTAVVGGYFVVHGSLDFASFAAALLVSTGMADALMPLMWMSNFNKKSQAAAIRIQEILDVEMLPESSKNISPSGASVVIDNVSFRYPSRDEYALKNVSFTVREGSVTALVGPSGAGKSTVAKLIPRFWDVDNGRILVGGVDIRDMSVEELTDNVSFVFQDTFLFNDTIFANIAMADPKASKNQVIEAAKAAQIHDFIESLPDGYDTVAGDRGARLSGGQKQRITIARAILRNSPIVVLDEATAFADPENEEEIIKALAELAKEKTVIVVAHRLSTIKDVDQIVVFDGGEAVGVGSHDELLLSCDVYKRLWSNYEKAQNWDLRKTEGGK